MFARLVKTKIKPGYFDIATRTFEDEIIPTLKKQRGFRDELSFIDEHRNEAVSISLWDDEQDALRYNREVYPKLRKSLTDMVEGTPMLNTFEVTNSTWYNLHA